ncbi:hypothetical protein J7384_02565 [Endozoicomonas sp. G2_1]|uniref:hypothetical protein n=1 Tax=Endozoicomonas sp. G2_1 TaxID=2821091 RepID=UPI001ADB85D0|nr:hypothetical protein [Endozoicomonas sp. G2_1]MBO9489238.1 hypothetical protein [Endozoicomonas sp. G2_1]
MFTCKGSLRGRAKHGGPSRGRTVRLYAPAKPKYLHPCRQYRRAMVFTAIPSYQDISTS